MYKSPIEVITQEITRQMDGQILKAVQAVDINVDKPELLRALQYDRHQYEKGYDDGYLAGYAAASHSNHWEDPING
jgi:hypothetical protein